MSGCISTVSRTGCATATSLPNGSCPREETRETPPPPLFRPQTLPDRHCSERPYNKNEEIGLGNVFQRGGRVLEVVCYKAYALIRYPVRQIPANGERRRTRLAELWQTEVTNRSAYALMPTQKKYSAFVSEEPSKLVFLVPPSMIVCVTRSCHNRTIKIYTKNVNEISNIFTIIVDKKKKNKSHRTTINLRYRNRFMFLFFGVIHRQSFSNVLSPTDGTD